VAGVLGQPRVVHLRTFGWWTRYSRSARRCRSAGPSARRASFMPRWVSQASNGPLTAPIAFWWNRSRSASRRRSTTSAPPITVGVAAEVLGGRMDDDVGAEGQRLLKVRGGERVVPPRAWRPGRGPAGHRGQVRSSLSSGFVGVSTQIILSGRSWPRGRRRGRDPWPG
jgi:hypothetical protein